jgi:hypothetical protein
MRQIISALKITLFCSLLALQACEKASVEPDTKSAAEPSLAQFQRAVLSEGQAFGDWPLKKVTYKQVIAQLGEQPDVSKSEVSEGRCMPYPNCSEEKYTLVRVSQGEFTFTFEHQKPGWILEDLRLEAVKVDCYEACDFKGLTGKGIRIGDSEEKVRQVYGNKMFKSEEWKASCYRSGICFAFDSRGETFKVYSILVVSPDKLVS